LARQAGIQFEIKTIIETVIKQKTPLIAGPSMLLA
jgi:hypothetical protein